MDLFYSPQYAKTGDVIPYYNEETKRFEGYYLNNRFPVCRTIEARQPGQHSFVDVLEGA